jgi:hypothetical protein
MSLRKGIGFKWKITSLELCAYQLHGALRGFGSVEFQEQLDFGKSDLFQFHKDKVSSEGMEWEKTYM